MKTTFFTLILLAFAVQISSAQNNTPAKPTETPKPMESPKVYEAKSSDVGSLDGIMKAVYDVISGDAGQKRDWDRFRSLFHKDARLIPTSQNPTTKAVNARALTPEDYTKSADTYFAKEGFYESELARTSETFGNITHVFSTYESRHKKDDKKPFVRGINSFQLLFDGKRWWIITIYWQGETPELQIPEQYLRDGKVTR